MDNDPSRFLKARTFLEGLSPTSRVVIFADFDGDGLSSAGLLTRALRTRGIDPIVTVKQRGVPPWSAEARAHLASLAPDALIVLDLGVQDPGLLEVPSLYIDHHVPTGIPQGPVVLVAHDWDPTPCTAWLTWEVVAPWLTPEDLWIAAVGVLSDLGDKAPWPHMAAFRAAFKITHVRKVVTLCNASRRASVPLSDVPLGLLQQADGPGAFTAGEAGRQLEQARQEVQAQLKRARAQRPIFATDGPWAHIPCSSACQVHPLIAQQWAQRLPAFIALASNDAYIPGSVAYSIRTKAEVNVPQILRAMPFADRYRDRFGHGHPKASGGQLPEDVWPNLLCKLALP